MFILQIFDWIFYVTHLYIYIATEHVQYGYAKIFMFCLSFFWKTFIHF